MILVSDMECETSPATRIAHGPKIIASEYKIAIMALLEISWKGNGIIQSADLSQFYSGYKDHNVTY
jgi:hypothetical protein